MPRSTNFSNGVTNVEGFRELEDQSITTRHEGRSKLPQPRELSREVAAKVIQDSRLWSKDWREACLLP